MGYKPSTFEEFCMLKDLEDKVYEMNSSKKNMTCKKDCLSCANSFSEPKDDGKDVLHCMVKGEREVRENDCCENWN